jgi:general nucleoside transport system permease protein
MDAGQISFWGVLLGGAVRLATPITLAALGETLVERGGIVNLGIEGMMALGAFLGVWGASTQSWGTGLLLGAIAGGSLGLLMGLAVLKGGVNQIVAGIAITLLGIGLADYLFQVWQPSGRSAVVVPLVPIVRLPLFERLPVIGGAFFAQSPLTYLAVVAVLVTSFALRRTTPGLKLRAVGDDPDAAELRGVDVIAARIVSLILGRWSPIGAMLGALVFALFDSVALLAQSGSIGLPVEFFSSLPYAMTLVALVLTARAHHAPRALGRGLND